MSGRVQDPLTTPEILRASDSAGWVASWTEREAREAGYRIKVGHSRTGSTTWDADISADRIRSDVEASLRVFGGEQLDLFYLHRVDLAEQPVEEGFASGGGAACAVSGANACLAQ